jgi:recombinational DNA repair protein (RecF pathway)
MSQWNFSPFDGGIVCDPCSCSRHDILPLGAAAIEVLSALQDSVTLPAGFSLRPSVVQEIRSVMLRFIQYYVHREIKSAGLLSQFSDQSGA